MGSWNFGKEYLTDWSYQIMSEEFDEDLYQDRINDIKETIDKEIEELIKETPYFNVTSKFYLGIELEDIDVESGYYDGVRLEPKFLLELIHDDVGDIISVTMEYDNHKDNVTRSYMEFIDKFIKEHFDNLVMLDALEIENFFYKVNNIMLEYCSPYSVGWTASEVSTAEAVCLMNPINGEVRVK